MRQEKVSQKIEIVKPIKVKTKKDQAMQITSRESLNFEYSSDSDEDHKKIMGDGYISVQVQSNSSNKQQMVSPSAVSGMTRQHMVEVGINHEHSSIKRQEEKYESMESIAKIEERLNRSPQRREIFEDMVLSRLLCCTDPNPENESIT